MICFTINIRIAELEVKCLPGRRSPSDEFPFNLLWTSFRMMEDSPWERKHFELPWILSCKNFRVQRGLGGYTVKICENVDAPLRPPFTTTKHCDGGVATAWFASSFVSRALKCVKEILKTFKGRYFQPWAGWPHGTIWNGWQSRMWLGRWGLKCGRQGRLSRFCNFTSGKLGKIHEQICSRRVKLKLRAVCRCCQDLRYTTRESAGQALTPAHFLHFQTETEVHPKNKQTFDWSRSAIEPPDWSLWCWDIHKSQGFCSAKMDTPVYWCVYLQMYLERFSCSKVGDWYCHR